MGSRPARRKPSRIVTESRPSAPTQLVPLCWNWQTSGIQNPVSARMCRFESYQWHQPLLSGCSSMVEQWASNPPTRVRIPSSAPNLSMCRRSSAVEQPAFNRLVEGSIPSACTNPLRTVSSVGQSICLLSRGSQVRTLHGPPTLPSVKRRSFFYKFFRLI